MGKPLLQLLAITLVVAVNSGDGVNNGTRPIIFRTSPETFTKKSADSGKAESRIDEEIISDTPKPSVSSQGYQREIIDDSSTEDSKGSNTQKATERQISVYPSSSVPQDSPPSYDQYLRQSEYDETSSKEDVNQDFIPKEKISYGDIQPKTDISKVRDLFVHKEVQLAQEKSHTIIPDPTQGYSLSTSSLEPKYKAEYDSSPIKYVNGPVKPNLVAESQQPESAPIPTHPHVPPHHHHHHHHDDEIRGHTAGYGHGFHHHQQKLKSKPLKPSVVYRDPSDGFDHHDKIRTLDKDHLGKGPHHPFGPHHPSLGGKGHELDFHHGHKPTHYDQSKIPECAHKNKYIYNLTFCLDDPHYPTETIIWAIKEAGPLARKLLSDITYQSADNLVTGLTRAEEEGYTYKHYFGATHVQNAHLDKYKPPYHGYTYSTDYFKKGGYICPSDIYYTRPKRAMNTYGKWKIIVNIEHVPHHGWGPNHHNSHEHHGKPVDIGLGIYGKGDYHHHHKHHIFHNELHPHHPHDEKHPPHHHEPPHYRDDEKPHPHHHQPPHYLEKPGHHHELHDEKHHEPPHHQYFAEKPPHHEPHHRDEKHPSPPHPPHHEKLGPYHHEEKHQGPPPPSYHHEEEKYVIHHNSGPHLNLDDKLQHELHNKPPHHHEKPQLHQDEPIYNDHHQKSLKEHHSHHIHHGEHGYSTVDSYLPHSIKKREYKEIKKSYTQTVRLEQCIYPNAPCSYIDSHYHSSCIQKHNFVRLLAWTQEEGLHLDTFKMPIACSCHVRQPIHFYHESGVHEHKHGHVVPPVHEYHHGPPPHEPHGGLKKLY